MKRYFRAALALCMAAGLLCTGCAPSAPPVQSAASSGAAQSTGPDPADELAAASALITAYLAREDAAQGAVYMAADAPAQPQEGDYRIDSLTYAGEARLYETVGVAYRVAYSRYLFTRDQSMQKVYDWHAYEPYYIVLNRDAYDDTLTDVIGRGQDIDPDESVEESILEIAYRLMDIEVSLRLDGYPQLVGPSSSPNLFREDFETHVLEDWELLYDAGDSWLEYRYTDLTAVCYYRAAAQDARIYNLETTRTDVETYRGLRVGATRDEALAAYPELRDTPYWDRTGDYLWYGTGDEGFGAALLLWFEGDRVARLELNNMFD